MDGMVQAGGCRGLRALNLSLNEMEDEGAVAVASGLVRGACPTLEALDLSQCGLRMQVGGLSDDVWG